MSSDAYFDHLAACDNDPEVLRQFVRLAYLFLDEESLTRLHGSNQFNFRTLIATDFKSLENERILGARGATFLNLLNILMLRCKNTRLRIRDLIASIYGLYNYVVMVLSSLAEEHIIILLVDAKY